MTIFEKIWSVLETPLAELELLQLLIAAVIVFFMILVMKQLFTVSKTGGATMAKYAKAVFRLRQRKMMRTVCPHCGRTLDKCKCELNKNASLSKRYKRYKKEQKARRLLSGQK